MDNNGLALPSAHSGALRVEPASPSQAEPPAVNAGDWVVFRESSNDPIKVAVKQASKVTPSLVKFDKFWPRQCHILSVVASYASMATAMRVRDSINGVAGEHKQRVGKANFARTVQISHSLAAANRQIARIVAGEA